MIRPDIAARLALLEAVTPVSVVPDATHDPSELIPGARVRARVEAQLDGGRFRVQVGSTPVQMQLPPGIRPGAMLELVFIGGGPRPTFALLNASPAPDGSATLSPAARLLSSFLQGAKADSVATPPYQATPVLEKPPGDTAEFSMRLQHAFSYSGLFYESHQAQWLAGRRTRDQLLQEPQGKLSPIRPQGKPDIAVTATPHGKPDVATPAAPSNTTAQSEPLPPAAPGTIEHATHKDALPWVQQQLAALDTGQMLWRGEVWPGQTMDWEITGESPKQDMSDEPPCWHSRLRLTLPRLGQITALLVLDARGVRIVVSAVNEPAVKMLRTEQPFLVRAMQDSGLNVSGVEVRHDDNA